MSIALSASFEYLSYASTAIIKCFDLSVFRRHFLGSKHGPRTERVDPLVCLFVPQARQFELEMCIKFARSR